MENFLNHCQAAGTLPDILGWHDLAYSEPEDPDYVETGSPVDTTRNLYAQIMQARGLMYDVLSDSSALPVEINEALMWDVYMIPGVIVREYALAEKARWDGLDLRFASRTFWDDPCVEVPSGQQGKFLAGLLNPGWPAYCPGSVHLARRYAWWAYRWYADLTGQFVRCDPTGKLDALASYDADDPELGAPVGRVVIGRFKSGVQEDLSIHLKNIDPNLVVNEAVHVAITRIYGAQESLFVARNGLGPGDLSSISRNYLVEGDSVVVNVDASDFEPGDALSVVLTRITPQVTIAPGNFEDVEAAIQATEVGNYAVVEPDTVTGNPWQEDPIALKNGVRVIVQAGTSPAVTSTGDTVLVFPDNANAFTTVEGLTILGGPTTTNLVILRGKGGLRNCTIAADSSDLSYGYGILVEGGTGFIDSCTVDLSDVSGPCDGIYLQGSDIEMGHTTLVGNSDVSYGIEGGSTGANHVYDCTVLGTQTGIRVRGTMTVEHSTVEGCSAYGIYGDDSHTSLVTNCIAANTGQASIQMTYASQTANYCIGEQGVIIYTGTGNQVEDPLFCGAGEYTLRADSYGNPDNNPSGELIGAYPVACLFGSLARDVSWDGGKPALPVLGDVTVSSARTLTLTSGARLEFAKGDNQGSGSDYEKSELIINGTLEIDGGGVVLTSGASPDSAGDWWGVHVGGTATIDSVTVEDAVYGVYFDDGAGSLTHSTLQNNDNADVMCANTYSGPVLIEDNVIHAHGARGIFLNYADSVTVRGNTITNNPPIGIDISGLTVFPFHEILIEGNTIQGGTPKVNKGIKMYGEGPKFRGNTIKDWQYGVYIEAGGPVFGIQDSSGSGDLITNNQVGVLASGDTAEVIIRECDIVNGSTGVITRSAGTVDLGTGLHGQNVKRGNNNLSGNSTYCIWNRNTGDEYLLAHFNYFGPCSEGGIPPLCWEGNVEVDGALCTAPASVSLGRELVTGEPKGLLVGGFAPNPLRGDGQIYFSLQEGVGKPSVQVYDVAGRLVWDFVGTEVGPGEHRIPWDAVGKAGQRLASGMYFIRVVVGDERQTVKVLVTR